MTFPGLFKNRYSILTGRDWLRNTLADDRRVFGELGLKAAVVADESFFSSGGRARAALAIRDNRGRFLPNR